MGRNVVVDMRIRVGACCACLAVLGGTLSACSLGDDGAAPLPEGSAAADTAAPSPAAVDPWTLPIEDRPELFNPCTEISLEDLAAAGLENPTPWPEAEDSSENPPMHQCGWDTSALSIVVGAHWTDFEQLATATESVGPLQVANGYTTALIKESDQPIDTRCGRAARTTRGMVTIDLIDGARSPNHAPNETCDAVELVFKSLTSVIPEPQND